MVGAISGLGSYLNTYQYRYPVQDGQRTAAAQPVHAERTAEAQNNINVFGAKKAAQPDVPVQPVDAAPAVSYNGSLPLHAGPVVREGVDPVEMSVRMRIQYGEDEHVQGAEAAQAAAEEGECKTCEERKYQDGSDDMGVSFQTPTRVDPDMAASAVRGHEMEHVVREQAKAQREDRKVVSQSVTYHTAICPECGKAYVSGGTTRTTTVSNPQQPDNSQQEQENQKRTPFSAVA